MSRFLLHWERVIGEDVFSFQGQEYIVEVGYCHSQLMIAIFHGDKFVHRSYLNDNNDVDEIRYSDLPPEIRIMTKHCCMSVVPRILALKAFQ